MRKVLKWSQYFMNIAEVVATKSKDPNTQVGCVITDKYNRIIATGYNGMAPGVNETNEMWQKGIKNDKVIHAEVNAILNAVRSVRGATLYCTHKPCQDCAKTLSAAGIKKVIFLIDRPQNLTTMSYLDSCGVEIRQL